MQDLAYSLALTMAFILFMLPHQFISNMIPTFVFMSMDHPRFIIIFIIMVAEYMNLSTVAHMQSLNFLKVIPFI